MFFRAVAVGGKCQKDMDSGTPYTPASNVGLNQEYSDEFCMNSIKRKYWITE